MKTVYLALGTNLGDRAAHLDEALRRLEESDVHVVAVSSRYETAPLEVTSQPQFLNMVAKAETRFFPRQLLRVLLRIEREMGRIRKVAKGPRLIDLDLLLYGTSIIRSPELEVPHPRMQDRRFVLEPLAELAPDLRHPVSRKTIRELLGRVLDQSARRA
ncbi:MAG: 2-amino-4-hydroxy-6-hydroxymethyldihydropteridine diphosphokinase [Bryobacteraceae bacterium]